MARILSFRFSVYKTSHMILGVWNYSGVSVAFHMFVSLTFLLHVRIVLNLDGDAVIIRREASTVTRCDMRMTIGWVQK